MLARNRNKISQMPSEKIFDFINITFLSILVLFFLYPFYYTILVSFNDGMDATLPGIYFWVRKFTLENYEQAFSNTGYINAAFISISRAVIGTFSAVIVSAAFGYAMSKSDLKFRSFYIIFATIPMFFGGGMIPGFLLIKQLGLYNNFLVYILPSLFSMYYAIIFMSSFKTLPASLEESAKLDGANQMTIFFRIIIPVSMPVIAAISIFTAVGHWNSWFDTMLFTEKTNLSTLAYIFAQVSQRADFIKQAASTSSEQGIINESMKGVTTLSVQLAAMVVCTAPIMIIYPFFQKHFVKGVMIGSVKG